MNYAAIVAHAPKMTNTRHKKLRAILGNSEAIWHASVPELIKSGLDEKTALELSTWRSQNSPEKIIDNLSQLQINTITLDDKNYPELLSQIPDAPLVLFFRGSLSALQNPSIALVGTREPTAYGKQITESLTFSLAPHLTIVSGLALGIDGLAHQTTLNAKGKTVGVLGSGIDDQHIYPSSHLRLAKDIIAGGGAITSEYPPGFKSTAYSFPERNRIIAGLTLGTLVIEAPEKSGSLITARAALDYNREVFAVPHPITSENGQGNNKLLKQGANVVMSATDILEVLNISHLQIIQENKQILPTSTLEETILNHLTSEATHIDALRKLTNLEMGQLMGTLTLMEMKGLVKNLGNMMYIKK